MMIANNQQQTGFSLIELLVSMTIGLFLLTGLATSFVTSKKASADRDQISVLEDNGRIALEIISRVIERTGYKPIRNVQEFEQSIITDKDQIVPTACTTTSSNIVKTSLFTDERMTLDDASGDSLAIVHYGDDNVFIDCGGFALPADCRVPTVASSLPSNASKIYSAFFTKDNNLYCVGSRDKALQTIATGIENIQFLYGIKSGNTNFVEQYVNATDITNWNNVVSIQVAILVRSQSFMKRKKEEEKFSLLDQEFTAPEDRYQRAVFTATIRLRNGL